MKNIIHYFRKLLSKNTRVFLQTNCVNKKDCDRCNKSLFYETAFKNAGRVDQGVTHHYMLNLCDDCIEEKYEQPV